MTLEIEAAAGLAFLAIHTAELLIRQARERKQAAKKPIIVDQPYIAPMPTPAAPTPLLHHESHMVEIVKRVGERWAHVGFRSHTHPDIAVALETEGLAVLHADGRIEAGTQA